MTGTMRAFVIKQVGETGIVEKPIPEPGPEEAIVKTGMRENNRAVLHLAFVIDQVEVESARCVRPTALAAEAHLHLMQKLEQRAGIERRPDARDRVHEGRIAGIGPCRAAVEPGSLDDRHAASGKLVERGQERLLGPARA